jgi:hypothetical protein
MSYDDKKRGYFLNLIKHGNNKNPKQTANLIKTAMICNQKNKQIKKIRQMQQIKQSQSQSQSQSQINSDNFQTTINADDIDTLKNVREMVRFEIKKSISNAKGSIIEEVKKEMNKISFQSDVATNGRNQVIESTIKNIEKDLTGESIVIFILHPEQHLQDTSDPDKLPNLVVVCDVGNDTPTPSSIESSIVVI